MPQIRNVSPYGALDVPLLHRVVEAGETVEVTAEQAKRLLEQEENWVKPTVKPQTVKKAAAEKAARNEAAPEPPASPSDVDGDEPKDAA